jgi:hypothetical protein
MKKELIFVGLAFFLLFFNRDVTLAADAAYNERWTCLERTYTPSDTTVTPISSSDGAAYQKYTHSAVLKTKTNEKPLPNSDTYIVECVQTKPIYDDNSYPVPMAADVKQQIENGLTEVCTTGSTATDMFIYNNDRLALIQKIYARYDNRFPGYLGYHPDGYYQFDFTNKLEPENSRKYFKTDANGDFEKGQFAYVNYITGPNERKFLAYNRTPKEPTDETGGKGALQQADIKFTFGDASKRCVGIAWDPFGIVFDTQTLEPVPGVSVALYVKKLDAFRLVNNADMPGGFIQNPVITKEDGHYSFVVPDGTYKLAVAVGGYTFPTKITTLHPNASVIYSDFYRGEDIIQKGKMVHKDIPIDAPSSPVTQKYQAKLMGLFQTINNQGDTIIDGRVSHPFAKINSYCKKNNGTKGTTNESVQADKDGQFSLVFDPTLCDLDSGETYGLIEVEAINLTGQLTMPSTVSTGHILASYAYNPILNYIEGYAMDNKNIPLSNATVGVYIMGDTNPSFTTKADATGRFVFTSDMLPNSPYELKYKSTSGSIVKTTTTQFIAQNISTIKKDNINLYIQKNSSHTPDLLKAGGTPSSLSYSSQSIKNGGKSMSKSSLSSQTQTKDTQKTQSNETINNIFALIAMLIVVALIGGVTIFLILKKQNSSPI